MTKTEINAYTNRITNASRTELIVIMYEIAKGYILSAIESKEQGDVIQYKFNLKKAKQFVNELNSVLDFKYNISYELSSIYMYMNRSLVEAVLTEESQVLPRLVGMLDKLREAFVKVSAQDNGGPVMTNVQSVYAGLTYSKSDLNVSYESQSNRGYLV